MIIKKQKPGEYPPYAIEYINAVPEECNVSDLIESNGTMISKLIASLTEEQLSYAYEAGKWTIKDILLHIMDSERIFAYRALCIVRGENAELPGFEQNDYVLEGRANERTIGSLLNEYLAVRQSTVALFRTFRDDDYTRTGVANKNLVSIRSLMYQIAGHELHHLSVIKRKYLI
ncbi:MAG: DinB family protein [Ignavibacteriales bacterium]|nr:DinB family protein [Ignavibacteriales bacterium]